MTQGTWWNWQTRMLEGHVPQGVEVQILSSPSVTVAWTLW